MIEQKLKYRNRRMVLTDQEREEIAGRIVKFMRECLVIDDFIREPKENEFHKERYKYFWYEIGNISVGNYTDYNRVREKDGEFKLSDESLFYDFPQVFGRMSEQIRLHGNKFFIDKLIEILGKKVAMVYLDFWAKKNMLVALLLEKIVKELKGER